MVQWLLHDLSQFADRAGRLGETGCCWLSPITLPSYNASVRREKEKEDHGYAAVIVQTGPDQHMNFNEVKPYIPIPASYLEYVDLYLGSQVALVG